MQVEQEIVAEIGGGCQCMSEFSVPGSQFSVERVHHGDAEIVLPRIEIFRQDTSTTCSFRSGDDHSVIEVESIGLVDFDRTPDQIVVWRDEF